MLKKIPFDSLFLSDLGWLQSRFHFSFAEYRNPKNVNFGVLRVMNDDLIAPGQGFGTHPHRDMEIISYIVRGGLTHEDSMGNRETLYRGDMQYMSAGSGVMHSEVNEGNEEVRILQMWIYPEANNLSPNYGSKRYDEASRRNRWLHLVGPQQSGADVAIYQDANIYVCELDRPMEFEVKRGRQLYFKLIEGRVDLNGTALDHGDAAEVIEEKIIVTPEEKAHLLLIEMAL